MQTIRRYVWPIVCLWVTLSGFASSSTDYTLVPTTFDGGGGCSAGGDYSQVASLEAFAAGTSTYAGAIAHVIKAGYVVQLAADPPVATPQISVATLEDIATLIVLAGTDAGGNPLTYAVSTGPSYGALSGTLPNLTYTPGQDYFGSDSFAFKVNNGWEDSAPATVSLTVTPVNDPPSFVKSADPAPTAQFHSPPAVTIANWATALRAGPANESGQGFLRFNVANNAPGLFSSQPAIALNGTLSYTPSPDRRGTATVSAQLQDNGGSANNGWDLSHVQTFLITVGLTTDNNGSGMPDDFEAIYWPSTGRGDPGLDEDGDGFTNQREFQAGTHPLNSADCLWITVNKENGQDVIRFSTVPGKQYQVQRKDDFPVGSWLDLGSVVRGTGAVVTMADPAATHLPKRIYRVIIVAAVPDVGADYHAYGADFLSTAFLTIYDQPTIRQTVRDQLQGMADRGATRISTRIWCVTEPGFSSTETWRATFPLSDQEQANLRAYAQDVAAIQGFGGNRLRLDLGLLWLGAADYQRGTPATGLGWTPVTEATFTDRVQTTTDKVLAAVTGVSRPDGQPVVETIYLNAEVMIGARANDDWFMITQYPTFVAKVTQAGFIPSVYFIVDGPQDDVLQDNYVDADYPVLNNHRSMYWLYRTLKFMVDHSLAIPPRIDFSYYVWSTGAPYTQLLTRVLDDADATMPTLGAPQSYALAETFYFADSAQRQAFGQAIATEMAIRERLKLVTFWTTPNAGGSGIHIGYPFAFEDYRLAPGN